MTTERRPRHLSNEPPGRQWELRKPDKRLRFQGFLRSALSDLYGTSLGRVVLVLAIPSAVLLWGEDLAADVAGALSGLGVGFGLLLLAWWMSGYDDRYTTPDPLARERANHGDGKTLTIAGFGVVTTGIALVSLAAKAVS